MNCTSCCGFNDVFSVQLAQKELRKYKKKGAKKNTKQLIGSIKKYNVEGKTLLDIGGGIGAIQFDFLKSGLEKATSAEASAAYLKISNAEAENQGMADKITYSLGDFVDTADEVAAADIVTLDKVICCYEDFHQLVDFSSQKATEIYGIILPRDEWWVKLVHAIENSFRTLTKSKFKSYIHPIDEIEHIIYKNGLKKVAYWHQREWLIALYLRNP